MTRKSVVIIGSEPVGIQAAIGFADLGFHVHLVESNPYLADYEVNWLSPLELKTLHLQLSHHPNITLWTSTKPTRITGKTGNLKIELRQHPRYIDLERCTACGDCVEVCPVTVPDTNHKAIYLNGEPGCYVIEKLGISPCANTCPGGIHVQGYIALIAQRRFQEALDLIRQAIPFPGICGRVCTHPCEVNCRRNEIDEPIAVRLLKRFVADWELSKPETMICDPNPDPKMEPVDKDGQLSVAIIGAGPGGMAVANELIQLGYQVTVYEKLPVVGGMMAVGIPRYRLPREVIDREYQQIIERGINLQLDTPIGPKGKFSLEDLFNMGHKAICLAVGAHQSLDLGIPGENLPGVLHGIDVLRRININLDTVSFMPLGTKTRVTIIGGGNTAMDVSRSLKRLGVENVTVLYRRSRQEMPAMPEEVEDALQEGIEIKFLISPLRILGDRDNGVSGLECIHMQLGEPDSSGRRRPVPIAESEFILDLDLVILAIGQNPNLEFLDPNHEISITREQRINVRDIDFMTSRPGLFAVGDAVTRDKMAVIEAIGMGKRAAAGIDAYLRGKEPHYIQVDSRQMPVAHRELSQVERNPQPRAPINTIPIEERKSTFNEVEIGFDLKQAVAEAKRCLACGPCSECQACVQVCQAGAIIHDEVEKNKTLKAGAIIFSNPYFHFKGKEKISSFQSTDFAPAKEQQGLFYLDPKDPLAGLAVMTQSLPYLMDYAPLPILQHEPFPRVQIKNEIPTSVKDPSFHGAQQKQIGVFICQCGSEEKGEISSVLNLHLIADILSQRPGVIHTQILPFSCSREGAQIIQNRIREHHLMQVVIAGCTCCSIDQVCYSCSYQRVRCKENFHIFQHFDAPGYQESDRLPVEFEFVNIREQCAWVHRDEPSTATEIAIRMIEAGISCLISRPQNMLIRSFSPKSTTIIGDKQASNPYIKALEKHGVNCQVFDSLPDTILRIKGSYKFDRSDQSHPSASLILIPKDEEEKTQMISLFENQSRVPQIIYADQPINLHHNGAFLISPGIDKSQTVPAIASAIALWLNHQNLPSKAIPVVDPSRCRGCSTCVEICEFGAPEIIHHQQQQISWIDPAICRGCGICTAHCPSNAITAGYSTDSQVEAMIRAIF